MNEEEKKVEETTAEAMESAKAEEAKTGEETTQDKAENVEAEVVGTSEGDKKELDFKDLFAGVSKNIKIIAGAVVALILIICIASCAMSGGSRFTTKEKEVTYFKTDSETMVTLDGKEITVDEGISSIVYSADKSMAVVKDKDATLFVVAGTELVEVAQEVEYFVISNYGDSIAYVTDTKDKLGTLNLYTVSKKKSVEIAEEVYAGDLVLSPDGKSVAYLSDCDIEEGFYGYGGSVTGSVYVSKNGKEGKEVAGDSVPLAVSNGGKHVFYIKDGKKLFMDEIKLGSDIHSRVYFNQDCTEIVFNEDDDTHYFTVKMKEPVKVKKGEFTGIYAPAAMVKAAILTSNSKYAAETLGIDSLNKALWCLNYCEAYYVFDKGEETEKLSNYLTKYQMSVDGKSMLYQDGGELLLIKDIVKSREEERVAHGLYGMNNFVASEDLKDIYYYNTDEDELCYLKKGEGVRIADDAENFVYSDKYGVIYFIEDDELFYATNSAKSKKDVCGEEVTAVTVVNGEVYFLFGEDDTFSIMKMKNKAKYESMFELDLEDIWNFDF